MLYHLIVLLEARGVALDAVMAELAGRTGRSGLEEKASRPPESGPGRGDRHGPRHLAAEDLALHRQLSRARNGRRCAPTRR